MATLFCKQFLQRVLFKRWFRTKYNDKWLPYWLECFVIKVLRCVIFISQCNWNNLSWLFGARVGLSTLRFAKVRFVNGFSMFGYIRQSPAFSILKYIGCKWLKYRKSANRVHVPWNVEYMWITCGLDELCIMELKCSINSLIPKLTIIILSLVSANYTASNDRHDSKLCRLNQWAWFIVLEIFR